MIFLGDLRNWKRKHRSLKPGGWDWTVLLVTVNLHVIPFHLLTITEHSSLGLSCCSTNRVAFQFSGDTKRLTARDCGWSSWLLVAVFACLSFCHMDPWFSPGHSISKGVRSIVGRVAKDGWTMEESTLWRVSTLTCKCIPLHGGDCRESWPPCVFSNELDGSGSHCHGSWRQGLSLTYTLLLAAGHCSTWIQLQSLFGKVLS